MRLPTPCVAVAILAAAAGCGRIPGSSAPLPASVWLLPAPDEDVGGQAPLLPDGVGVLLGGAIAIDSASFRPVTGPRLQPPPAGTSRVALLTTYQGLRYHPESIRALAADPIAAAGFAGLTARAAMEIGNGLFIDFQGATPDELRSTISLLRTIADSARATGAAPIGVVVPPGDTSAYPTGVLARTADVIVLRLWGEHRAGTSPGPLVSPDWMTRQIGLRASAVGVARLVAELPLFGYRWNRDGTVQRLSYAEAESLVRSEAGSFRRDPASGSLTASSSRNGWTIWIVDAESIDRLIAVARQAGMRRFALAGAAGADPAIWTRVPAALSR